jgi:hypothetical protein
MDRVQAMQKIADVAVGSAFENLKFKLRAVFGARNIEKLEKPFPHYRIVCPDGDDDIIVAVSKNLPDAEHRVGDLGIG